MDDKAQVVPEATKEDKHVAEVIEKQEKKYRLTPKYQMWEKLYWDKRNKDTYLNATQSAIQAYNLDPVRQYEVAEQIGSENISKHRNLAARYYREKGKDETVIFNLFWEMMLARKDINQLYAIAQTMGVQLPEYKPVSNPQFVLNQQNNQFNVGEMSVKFSKEENEVIEGEEVGDAQHQTDTSTISDSERQPQV